MSITTTALADSRRGPRLRGLTWLVWRQHRAAFWTGLAITAAGIASFAYQRASMMDYLNGIGWPHSKSADWSAGFETYDSLLSNTSSALGLLMPVLVGVFLGAPLIANDLEHGTGKLVTSQAVSRGRWLATKLGMAVLVVTVCTAALSAAFGWWLGPVSKENPALYWVAGSATGPLPVALTLLTMVGGVAIGMLLRRTLLSMVVTFGFAVTIQLVWAFRWRDLGNVTTITTHDGARTLPDLPQAAYEVRQSYLTSSGELLGRDSCALQTEQAINACLDRKDVVGWSVDYLPPSELSPMLWTGSAILLTLTAAVAVFICWWGRKRLY
ncbi:ABC-type transport system involved in multi-copper enzyme maturation permease subunit [Streptomyces sp. V4I23]|uniref:ABC transporter permease n=1 Tax=Streptomyces sp. V4I23 TaxID=3042282 RepID=UPI00278978A3|nr:ABC transporter permease [Streptomyces sp. V4I23]MDQ1005614.1 ABC-type transport system involved in multi-copper enzyme maturation permease subunit [Streptomyces sp. V4I23]